MKKKTRKSKQKRSFIDFLFDGSIAGMLMLLILGWLIAASVGLFLAWFFE